MSYIVVTGVLKIEGGASTKTVKHEGDLVTREFKTTTARDRAASIRADAWRRLNNLGPLQTPFGRLYEADKLPEIIAVFDEVTQRVSEFNQTSTNCSITNGYVWEHLAGNRLASVEGWAYLHGVKLAAA